MISYNRIGYWNKDYYKVYQGNLIVFLLLINLIKEAKERFTKDSGKRQQQGKLNVGAFYRKIII